MAKFTLVSGGVQRDVDVVQLGPQSLVMRIDGDYPVALDLDKDTLKLCVWTQRGTDQPDYKIELEY